MSPVAVTIKAKFKFYLLRWTEISVCDEFYERLHCWENNIICEIFLKIFQRLKSQIEYRYGTIRLYYDAISLFSLFRLHFI